MLQLLKWVIPYNIFFDEDTSRKGGDKEEIEDHEPPEPPEQKGDDVDDIEEDEISDNTKLSEIENIDDVVERDDIDIDKLLNWIKEGGEDVKFGDIKIKPEVDDDKEKDKKEKDTDDKEDVKDDDVDDKEKADKDKKESDDKKEQPDDKSQEDKTKEKDQPSDKPDKKEAKPFKITDDFIKKQLSDFRESLADKDEETKNNMVSHLENVLSGIKGEVIGQKAFNNYVNGQFYIKKVKSPFDKNWKPEQDTVKDPEYIEKATKQKNKMLVTELQKKYKDFPDEAFEDPEIKKEFERNLNQDDPSAFKEYQEKLGSLEKDINDQYDRYYHFVNNWESIAAETLKTETDLFREWLNAYGLQLKDVGIDSLDIDDNYYNKYLWDNVVFDKDGKMNEDVLVLLDGVVPVIKPMSVMNALKNSVYDEVLKIKTHQARQDGYTKAKDDIPDPSLSDSGVTGQREEIANSEENVFEDDNASLEEHNKALERVKKSMFSGKKNKR